VITKCSKPTRYNLSRHRKANTDLYLTHYAITCSLNIEYNWVKGHSNKSQWKLISDLKDQKLGRDDIYNIWCDFLASEEWRNGTHSVEDPDVSPNKQWAVYSKYPYFHKITDDLTCGIYSTISYESLLEFICKKHGLTSSKMRRVNIHALQRHLASLKPHKRATLVKLIHGWQTTYGHLAWTNTPLPPLPHPIIISLRANRVPQFKPGRNHFILVYLNWKNVTQFPTSSQLWNTNYRLYLPYPTAQNTELPRQSHLQQNPHCFRRFDTKTYLGGICS